jgi:hypothetical protein
MDDEGLERPLMGLRGEGERGALAQQWTSIAAQLILGAVAHSITTAESPILSGSCAIAQLYEPLGGARDQPRPLDCFFGSYRSGRD